MRAISKFYYNPSYASSLRNLAGCIYLNEKKQGNKLMGKQRIEGIRKREEKRKELGLRKDRY